MESFWNPYEQSEEKELLKIAKKRKIKEPPKGTREYDAFLDYIRTLLPHGFVYKTGIRKLGDVYEKVEFKTMKQKLKELGDLQKELPIKLTPEEQKYSDKFNEYKFLLNKLSEEELRHCIINAVSTKPTIRINKYTPSYKAEIRRNQSKKQLEKSLKDVPIGLTRFITISGEVVDNIVYKIGLLENYIFKLTKDNNQAYYTKIKDIVFIFEHYHDFKIKFLQILS